MIIRKIDNLGRIVIPMEMRKELNMNIKDKIEIVSGENQIILRKHEEKCIFCKKAKSIYVFKDKRVCNKCLNELENAQKIEYKVL